MSQCHLHAITHQSATPTPRLGGSDIPCPRKSYVRTGMPRPDVIPSHGCALLPTPTVPNSPTRLKLPTHSVVADTPSRPNPSPLTPRKDFYNISQESDERRGDEETRTAPHEADDPRPHSIWFALALLRAGTGSDGSEGGAPRRPSRRRSSKAPGDAVGSARGRRELQDGSRFA